MFLVRLLLNSSMLLTMVSLNVWIGLSHRSSSSSVLKLTSHSPLALLLWSIIISLSGGVALSRRSSSLNDQDVIIKDQDYHLGQDVEKIFLSHLRLQAHTQIYLSDQINGLERRNILPDTYGYVTHDSCPGLGDDTPHLALPVYDPPEYIGTGLPPHTTQVDIVFYESVLHLLDYQPNPNQTHHLLLNL